MAYESDDDIQQRDCSRFARDSLLSRDWSLRGTDSSFFGVQIYGISSIFANILTKISRKIVLQG